MHRFSFRRGLKFLRQSRVWAVVRRLTDGSIQLESEDGELWNTRESMLLNMCKSGSLAVDLEQIPDETAKPIISRDLSSFPEELQKRACRRQAYLMRLQEHAPFSFSERKLKPLIAAIAHELGDKTTPSLSSIRRWHSRYRSGHSVIALADRWETRGRVRNWSIEIQRVIADAIDTILLNAQKYPKKAVCEEVERNVLAINRTRPEIDRLKLPSQASLYRYLSLLEDYEMAANRLGKAAAERQYRSVIGRQVSERILERWEIDHTPINMLVFCNRSLLPIGRPWLTIIIDKASRMVMGYYVGFHTPSTYSVLQCIKQAILHKDELLSRYPDITVPWPARGIPEIIVCDNGMELHSNALSKVCQELGIQLMFCPAKKPEYKGAIERFLRTINHDLIHRLPGTVFSSSAERGDYEAEKLACISFEDLIHFVTKWIVEIYGQTVHRGIGVTPLEKWEIGERERIIEYPAEPAQLEVIIGHSVNRRVFHYGVELNNLYYNNHDLQMLRRRFGKELRVQLKYYEDDLGYLHVFDPDQKAYIHVPAIDQDYAAGLRLIQHELIREKLRDESKDPDRQQNLLHKKKELQDLIQSATNSQKMARRKHSFVVAGVNSASAKAKPNHKNSSPADDQPLLVTDHQPNPSKGPLPVFSIRSRAGGTIENPN